jgi:hypothetical protein
MEYQKTYRNPKNEKEEFIVSWERGYRSVQIHYRNELIGEVIGIRKLIQGEKFEHSTAGTIEIKLKEDPYFIQLIVDGFHSPDNLHYPISDLPKIRGYFTPSLLINGLGTFINILLYFNDSIISQENYIFMFFYIIPIVLTIAGNVMLSTKNWVGYLINFSSAFLQFLLPVLAYLFFGDPIFIIMTILFSVQFIVMFIPLKRVLNAYRHVGIRTRQNSEIIDL